ncbi:MAG: hypothetical protein M3304_07715 [Actinomycetota bacterium]|nr:hypothetical protein [Actinomycetota bacterium]
MTETRNEQGARGRRRRGRIAFGPGELGGWSPEVSGSAHFRDEDEWWREREVEMIERALADRGEMRRRDLGNLIGCKYWGPGRFRRALAAAVEEGRIRRVGFGRYAPAEGRGS